MWDQGLGVAMPLPSSAPPVLIGTARASKSAGDMLLLVLSDVPADKMGAFIEDYARRKLGPVVAAKIVAQGGDPKEGDAALVIARAMLEDAARRLHESGLRSGRG